MTKHENNFKQYDQHIVIVDDCDETSQVDEITTGTSQKSDWTDQFYKTPSPSTPQPVDNQLPAGSKLLRWIILHK